MDFRRFDTRTEKRVDLRSKFAALLFGTLFLAAFFLSFFSPKIALVSPLPEEEGKISSLKGKKAENLYEVFGFAPHWTLHKTANVDFGVLTTLAYFAFPIKADGSIDKESPGFTKFYSETATKLFKRAHKSGTRVVLTITQMDNNTIKSFLNDKKAQEAAIESVTNAVVERGIDGINVDFEYTGTPGGDYREKFSKFVKDISDRMHAKLPDSQVTVSVYASAVIKPKMYDVASLAASTDGVFMMAYDFATHGSDNVIPTAPLYGHKEGKYWYDISTAVDDFLKVMPKEKLILGLPWYGYEYPVKTPVVKTPKDTGYYTYYWYRGRRYSRFIERPRAHASTYAAVLAKTPDREGWDEYGQVGWRAYKAADGWRMIFLDDVKSLGIKYDFAKEKDLAGVGVWALGFDQGSSDMWSLLTLKFGRKLVDARLGVVTYAKD